jgi:hypothetical protein
MAQGEKKLTDFFECKGKRYGWKFPTIRDQIGAATRREAMCGGFFGQMLGSPSVVQTQAAQQAMMLTELELYIVQYPDGEPEGLSHIDDHEVLTELFSALKTSVDTFRKRGADAAGGEE